jgi:hypothetical protein
VGRYLRVRVPDHLDELMHASIRLMHVSSAWMKACTFIHPDGSLVEGCHSQAEVSRPEATLCELHPRQQEGQSEPSAG